VVTTRDGLADRRGRSRTRHLAGDCGGRGGGDTERGTVAGARRWAPVPVGSSVACPRRPRPRRVRSGRPESGGSSVR